MKKLFGSIALLLALTAATSVHNQPLLPRTELAATETTVYVCMSKGSVAYHSSDRCAGLNRCTHTVKSMTAADAQEIGKRACMKCK